MKPAEGDRNSAIIDGADYMTDRAQNRFLKTLEEPTPGTVIVLLSENTLTLMPTINSRCIHYRLTDLDSGPDGEMARSAADVLTRIREGALFGEITALLDQAIKDRRTARQGTGCGTAAAVSAGAGLFTAWNVQKRQEAAFAEM